VCQGTVGAGTIQHLCGLRLHERLDAKWSFIPYRGGGPAMQDMLAGQFDFMCTASGSFLPLVRAKQIRAYAVTAKTRMEGAPEIPTVDEAGLPGFYVGVWNALWAPAKTPPAIIVRLNDAGVKAMNDEGLRKKIIDMGLDMPPKDQLTPEALGKLQRAEADVWWPIMSRMKDETKK
jgi:tripartite-type tricarboxylate transporter receptor subunit TctC